MDGVRAGRLELTGKDGGNVRRDGEIEVVGKSKFTSNEEQRCGKDVKESE